MISKKESWLQGTHKSFQSQSLPGFPHCHILGFTLALLLYPLGLSTSLGAWERRASFPTLRERKKGSSGKYIATQNSEYKGKFLFSNHRQFWKIGLSGGRQCTFWTQCTQGSVKRVGQESCSTEALPEAQQMIHHLPGQSSLPIPTLLQSFELTRLLL